MLGAANAGPHEDAMSAAKRGDFATALRIWRPLAEQGHVDAQASLGFLHSRGYGVRQDHAEAARWFRRAAESGNANAQALLGVSYDRGEGVALDYAEAMRWYRKAAAHGHAHAQRNLARMYSSGRGAPRDRVQAYMWYELALPRFPAADSENRKKVLKARDAVAAKMTPAQIAEAKRMAREWKPQ